MDNIFGRYTPAKQMVKNRRRAEVERMEMEAKEADKCKCEGGSRG